MKTYCKQNLVEIKKLILKLSNEEFVYVSKLLSEATIGQHIRHILEFYQSIINTKNSSVINYDNRKRNLEIETNSSVAIQIIDEICAQLTRNFINKQLILEGNFCADEGRKIQIQTTLNRELAYCLEHSIHHQALIKVGLIELEKTHYIESTFGIAPATIRYKKVCVQ
ncbi:MAG: DinB family protein [Lutibacter sp.]|uniref:DinB family protein n=1 Tax=Lutibacter sp. TaxID=1925666 RepID=UPI00385D234E